MDSILAGVGACDEVIVVNDGSTDSTEAILKVFGSRITLISQENMGEAQAVNRGFSVASGEYIVVVNADDLISPALLDEAVAHLEERQDAVVAYPAWTMIDPHGCVLEEVYPGNYSRDRLIARAQCLPGPGSVIRRSAISTRLRNPAYRYVSDYDCWLRLSLVGEFVYMPRILAAWRMTPEGASQSAGVVDLANERYTVMEDFFRLAEIPPEVRSLEAEALGNAALNAAFLGARNRRLNSRRWAVRAIRESGGIPTGGSWWQLLAMLMHPMDYWSFWCIGYLRLTWSRRTGLTLRR